MVISVCGCCLQAFTVSYLLLLIVVKLSIICHLNTTVIVSIPVTHTHAHIVDGCLLRDECVAGMVIRKEINMRTRWTSVSLCLFPSVSAAQLIHLQLSRLVKQVRGNAFLNPQSGPAGCGGSDRWSRVTRPGVSVSLSVAL